MEWKDKVYADVSYSKIDDESILVRTEIVNNSEIMQNCLINYFSSIEYPYTHYTRLVTPEKFTYKDATDYDEYVYNTPRPWDEENPDGLKKGEFRSSEFVNETGLGDRVGKWHMPHRVIKPFGYEKGDQAGSECSKSDRADQVKDERCSPRKEDGLFQTAIIVRAETVSQKRQNTLGESHGCIESQHIDLFGNAHSCDGCTSIFAHQGIGSHVGEHGHGSGESGGNTDGNDVSGNVFSDSEFRGRQGENLVVPVLI
jgi:hypothetical protein